MDQGHHLMASGYMADKQQTAFKVTSAGSAYLDKASELLTRCFEDDPAIRFMMSSLSDEARASYLPAYMHALLKAAALNDALFEEANDWACTAVWMPPCKRVDNPFTLVQAGFLQCLFKLGVGGCKRMLIDFQSQADKCKKLGLRDAQGRPIKRYHYLFFIGTDPNTRGQGLATKMIHKYQQHSEGMPIWLEATTKHSRDIYERTGFREVQKMEVGVGTHAASGAFEKGGPGVCIWAMIWFPSNYGSADAADRDRGIVHNWPAVDL